MSVELVNPSALWKNSKAEKCLMLKSRKTFGMLDFFAKFIFAADHGPGGACVDAD